MNFSFAPLLDALARNDAAHLWLTLDAVSWEGNDLTLRLVAHSDDNAEVPWTGSEVPWTVHCRQVRDSVFRSERIIADLTLVTDDPLLLPYVSPVVELYFKGSPANAEQVVGQLLEAHRAVVGDWYWPVHFLNLGPYGSVREMLQGGFGKFAEGPQPLIQAYADVLHLHGVATTCPSSRPPSWWDGNDWIEETAPLTALILGQSYVIAASFQAERA